MANYFRITGYHPEHDICLIADSNGRFEKKWQFSAYLLKRGIKIIEVGDDTQFKGGNLPKVGEDTEHIILRACGKGKPNLCSDDIEVSGKFYTPNTLSNI